MADSTSPGSIARTTARALFRIPASAARGLIKLYRYTLSSLVGRTCRHLPTCSEFADEAIARHGLWAGGWMGLARLWRCRPFGSHGFDPVPERAPAEAAWYRPWRYGRWRGGEMSTNQTQTAMMRADPMEASLPEAKPAPELEEQEFKFKEPGEDPEYDAWFKEQVQIGLDEADRGELIPHEEVEREWQRMRADLLRR